MTRIGRRRPRRSGPERRYCLPDPAAALTDELIAREIPEGCRVVDLGCGDGRLIEMLRRDRACDVIGVEVDEESVVEAVGRGVPTLKLDLDEGLPDLPDDGYDVAVLSQTLQQVRRPRQVLQELKRIAPRALVTVPNFGHWKIRWQVARGRTPVTSLLPYEWYDTPNLHVMTMRDFRELATSLGFKILKEIPILNGVAVERAWAANFRADSALYVLRRK
ncbi:MAG: methionine biosynthesis protein MetW [Planctomycetota bacterium]